MKRENNGDILRISNLSIKLGGRIILGNIDINVRKGEMLGIVGISGVGKTSLLNAIIGYYPIMNGDVLYFSPSSKKFMSTIDNLPNFKKLFGFSAQNPSFYPELSVMENLEYFANLYKIPDPIKELNIKKAVHLVELRDYIKVPAKNLSGGMKKRLDIACSIIHNPKILILDEPTSDVDPFLRVQIWGLMESINRSGTTVIVASHFLSEVEHMCDRIVFLHNQHVEFTGTPKEFRNLYAKVKEIHIATKEGTYDLILNKVMNIPFLEIKHVFKKKGRIVLHSRGDEKTINSIISKLLRQEDNISDIEVKIPSMDALFKLFVEK